MEKAWVSTNILDLWAEPKFNSERASQVLFGETVETGERSEQYVKATLSDGYSGWLDNRFLIPLQSEIDSSMARMGQFFVTTPWVRVYRRDNEKTAPPHVLFYGTKFYGQLDEAGRLVIPLPNGQTLNLRNSGVTKIRHDARRKPSGQTVVREAEKFLGVPYLWGGVTVAGCDCSGMVQTIYKRFGIHLPRDTKDQITVGKQITREEAHAGDLFFFKRHVGIALDKDHFIHSSVGGSGVRIQSLVPGAPDYREDLNRDFAQARRIV